MKTFTLEMIADNNFHRCLDISSTVSHADQFHCTAQFVIRAVSYISLSRTHDMMRRTHAVATDAFRASVNRRSVRRKWTGTVRRVGKICILDAGRFSRIIEGDACKLVYGFDPEGAAHVELWSSPSEPKLITGINVVRRR